MGESLTLGKGMMLNKKSGKDEKHIRSLWAGYKSGNAICFYCMFTGIL